MTDLEDMPVLSTLFFLFSVFSHGVLLPSSLRKLMSALLKYRVCTLSPVSLRKSGS